MTIEGAISYYEGQAVYAKDHGYPLAGEWNGQIAAWLRELAERRKAPDIIYCHECKHFQCNMRFDGYVPKGAEAYECRHWCGGCDPMDYCSYGERAERRTDGQSKGD